MSGVETRIKKIPYGISDYEKIVSGNCYYVDKTPFLKTIEQAGDYLFLIRPRRFGKSLFLSLMEGYYDVFYKERFEELFKGTAIFESPTPDQGAFLVLSLNFSMVEPASDKVETSFLNHVKNRAILFIHKYRRFLTADPGRYVKTIEASQSAADTLSTLSDLSRACQRNIYAVIDEYDNFANTILSTSGETAYWDLTHGKGFFRSFFNMLKGGTGGMGAPFKRLFLTGVSPVTLDDVTSGCNIGENISIDAKFNTMLGFTRQDVKEILDYYRSAGLVPQHPDTLMEIMDQWYNNYRFSAEETTTLYNSDMVLYFFKECFKTPSIPRDLIDRNVRIDYGKLRHLIIIDKKSKKENNETEANGNFSRLREIIEEGEVASKIMKGFPLEEMNTEENFTSLLFYFGLLTAAGEKEGLPLLKIPNQTVKTLFYDYIIRISRDIDMLNINIGKLDTLLHGMAYHGNWQAFFDHFTKRMEASTSIRDFFSAEKAIQGFLLAYLGISDYFIVHSEKELGKGYADIVMEPFLARYTDMKYSYLVEIKYFPKPRTKDPGTIERKAGKLKQAALEQLSQYSGDENFDKTIGKTTLIKLVLVFCGSRLVYVGEG
jgi:hypothetical protein